MLPFEIGNALSAMVKRGRLDNREAALVYEETQKVPVELCSVDIKRALELACKYKIYAYDAYFLECALVARCPLLTIDTAMRQIATQLGIILLEDKT